MTATRKHVKAMLMNAHIAKGGTVMVAPGLKPCGVPCKCGAKRTKHLDGLAVDLNMEDLKKLTMALNKAKAGTLDEYLKKFGLHRPLLSHKNPEPHHIEALRSS